MPKASETVAAIINAATNAANDVVLIVRAAERLEILNPQIEDLLARGHQHEEIAENLRFIADQLYEPDK